jgi:tight adherence protein B
MLDDIARRCATGESLTQAFVTAPSTAALAPTFDSALTEIQRGATLAEGLARTPTDDSDLALTVHVLLLCSRVGGNVSESLDRAAATLRERDAALQERAAQSAQARLSARVLTLVPMTFAGWTTLTSTRVRAFTLTPAGTVCLCLGLLLNGAGSRAMRSIIRGAQ